MRGGCSWTSPYHWETRLFLEYLFYVWSLKTRNIFAPLKRRLMLCKASCWTLWRDRSENTHLSPLILLSLTSFLFLKMLSHVFCSLYCMSLFFEEKSHREWMSRGFGPKTSMKMTKKKRCFFLCQFSLLILFPLDVTVVLFLLSSKCLPSSWVDKYLVVCCFLRERMRGRKNRKIRSIW